MLDRNIGTSTPLSTYRAWEMHHTLRYGKHDLMKVLVYGDITEQEKATFIYTAERNAVNNGYRASEVLFFLTRLRKRSVLYENSVYQLQSQKKSKCFSVPCGNTRLVCQGGAKSNKKN